MRRLRNKGEPATYCTKDTEAAIRMIGERAKDLYLSRTLFCSEAVLTALNHGLGGGLTDDQAVAAAAPFGDALGESGCMCGALAGAVMGVGVVLGKTHPYRHRRQMRVSARYLHDTFRAAHGGTCCRVISKRKRHQDRGAHFHQCALITAQAAEMAARHLLDVRPDLIAQTHSCPACCPSRIAGAIRCLFRMVFH